MFFFFKENATMFDENNFVNYKHHKQIRTPIIKGNNALSNCHVVLYNKDLLLYYNAHINNEICCQSMVIKYLFKYFSKGVDRCMMVVQKKSN